MEHRRRQLLQLAASATLAGCGMARAAAASVAAGGAARPVSVVGTTFSRLFEPASASPGGPPVQGLAVDLLDAILLPAGFAPRYELLPWLRAQSMIEHGPADILVGPYRTPEREKRMRFSQLPFYEDALVFYVRSGQQDLWRDEFASLRRWRVGAVQGWVYGERFDQARSALSVTSVRDLSTALRMLQRGRLDLVAANQRNSEPVIQELGLTDQVQLCAPPFARLRGHFAFSLEPQGAAWHRLVDAGMQRLRASGELQQLARRRGVTLPD
ncbi:substrate-binding periplasmic protein [Roseateles amylovorans]|uniref:Transporter substrate-binding domain-containing protein n=1 Tax=Roseateles amylovorans TaxID=2978473 RepID=A0ABY6B1Y7_9BURK|nr:transporter substrate-binding domain-containing protein [Roseateles amylovorans]UXH78840.1 transporter substrate-binding domain-containing protein [Roseateles amylovorans]